MSRIDHAVRSLVIVSGFGRDIGQALREIAQEERRAQEVN